MKSKVPCLLAVCRKRPRNSGAVFTGRHHGAHLRAFAGRAARDGKYALVGVVVLGTPQTLRAGLGGTDLLVARLKVTAVRFWPAPRSVRLPASRHGGLGHRGTELGLANVHVAQWVRPPLRRFIVRWKLIGSAGSLTYVVVLDPGDEAMAVLSGFAADRHLTGA